MYIKSGKPAKRFKGRLAKEYYLDIEYYEPNSWTGLESQLSLIGLYSDSQFKNLIDPKLIESVSQDLNEI